MGFRCWLFGHRPPPEVEYEFPNYNPNPSPVLGTSTANYGDDDKYVFPNSLGIKKIQDEKFIGAVIQTVHSGAILKNEITFFLHAGRFAVKLKPCMRCGVYFEKHKPDKSQIAGDHYLDEELNRTKKVIED